MIRDAKDYFFLLLYSTITSTAFLRLLYLLQYLSSNSLAILYCSTAFIRFPVLRRDFAYKEYLYIHLLQKNGDRIKRKGL